MFRLYKTTSEEELHLRNVNEMKKLKIQKERIVMRPIVYCYIYWSANTTLLPCLTGRERTDSSCAFRFIPLTRKTQRPKAEFSFCILLDETFNKIFLKGQGKTLFCLIWGNSQFGSKHFTDLEPTSSKNVMFSESIKKGSKRPAPSYQMIAIYSVNRHW